MTGLECRTHQFHVTHTFKGVVRAAIGHLDDHFLNRLVVVVGIDCISGAQLSGDIELAGIDVHADDSAGLGHLGADDGCQADAAETEDGHSRAFLNFGGVQNRADTGGHATAQQADLVQGCLPGDLRQGDFRQHGVLGESRATHVVVQRLALVGEAGGAIRHHTLALGCTNGATQVGFARGAELALATFSGIEGNDVVTDFQSGYAGADRFNNTATFMAKDSGKQALWVSARQGVSVGMAYTGGNDTHQDLALLRRGNINFNDFQRLVGFKRHRGTGFNHWQAPLD